MEIHLLAEIWDQLLSREPERILAGYGNLQPEEQVAVVAHLRRMTTEAGWHPEQARSARAALKALSIVEDGN